MSEYEYNNSINNPPNNNGEGDLLRDSIQRVINKYGNGKAPLNADDFIKVSKTTNVPVALLLAHAVKESNIGTKGMAVRTHNVANVGNNTGTKSTDMSDFSNGLMKLGNLLSSGYKANTREDVERLIANNFQKPGTNYHYAGTAPNYGRDMSSLLNTFSKMGVPIGSVASNFKTPDAPAYVQPNSVRNSTVQSNTTQPNQNAGFDTSQASIISIGQPAITSLPNPNQDTLVSSYDSSAYSNNQPNSDYVSEVKNENLNRQSILDSIPLLDTVSYRKKS